MKMFVAGEDGNLVKVSVSGPVTQRELAPVDEPLGELLGPLGYGKQVLLDLSDVSYLDSSGVGWLLTCHKRIKQAGGVLIVHSFSPIVSNVLRVLKLERVLQLATSAKAAEQTARGVMA
jgi:anti-sigma B factor antagonist